MARIVRLPCFGCTDPGACNYDVEATIDDGTCLQATDAPIRRLRFDLRPLR